MQSIVESVSNPSSNDVLARGKKMCKVRVQTLDAARLVYSRHTDGDPKR